MVIESAVDRVVRVLVVSIGIGSVVFTLLGLPSIIDQHATLSPAFAMACYIVYLGVPPVLALLAFRLPVPVLRVVLGVHAAAAIVFLAGWQSALTAAAQPTDNRPWILFVIAVGCCGAALVLPYLASIGYVLVVAVGSGLLRFALYASGDASPAVQDGVLVILFSGMLVTLLHFALRSARLQDAAVAEAQRTAIEASSAESFERQRLRYQQFTRDEVLAVFDAVLADGKTLREQTRQSATRVLAELDELTTDPASSVTIDAAEFEALLRAAARDAIPLEVTAARTHGSRAVIPAEVGDTLAEAFGEAVLNTLRHADRVGQPPAERQALVSIDPDRIRLEVSDDGRGFTPSRIPSDRLGVRVNILQAVNALPGGEATVESSRGMGTTVVLTWTRPAGSHDGEPQ